LVVEQRAKDAELLASRILEDSEQRAQEMERLIQELEKAKEAELIAKKKLTSMANVCIFLCVANLPSYLSFSISEAL